MLCSLIEFSAATGLAIAVAAANKPKTGSLPVRTPPMLLQITQAQVIFIPALVTLGFFYLFIAMTWTSSWREVWQTNHPQAPWYQWFEFWNGSIVAGVGANSLLKRLIECFQIEVAEFFSQLVVAGALLQAERLALL
jgi:hypothetical protein